MQGQLAHLAGIAQAENDVAQVCDLGEDGVHGRVGVRREENALALGYKDADERNHGRRLARARHAQDEGVVLRADSSADRRPLGRIEFLQMHFAWAFYRSLRRARRLEIHDEPSATLIALCIEKRGEILPDSTQASDELVFIDAKDGIGSERSARQIGEIVLDLYVDPVGAELADEASPYTVGTVGDADQHRIAGCQLTGQRHGLALQADEAVSVALGVLPA